ncbi:hypothetical protein J9174_08800 [Macrococcoides canis]|uniref:hypothetical protein n=1 Tax=Macrococcoides canis TaxID=1855823 RepID=UPI001AEC20C7|nr:hypothetical protein [Macrococcus canis]QTQ07522.1 hypothetical protein J9174_08800 [Macrococcus canis]
MDTTIQEVMRLNNIIDEEDCKNQRLFFDSQDITSPIYVIEKPFNDDGFSNLILFDYNNLGQYQNVNFPLMDFYTIIEKLEEDNQFVQIYVTFKDWETEQELKNILIRNSSKAVDKRKINNFFDRINALYISSISDLTINVDQNGINYLENIIEKVVVYPNENSETANNEEMKYSNMINSYIFNVSFDELFNLYNVTGNSLFDLNVRSGIKNKTSKKLKENFRSYIKNSVYLISSDKNIKSYLEEQYIPNKDFMPEFFWHSHNGINIYIYNETKLNQTRDKITLKPRNCSVINGAQTITNLFNVYKEIHEELHDVFVVHKKISEPELKDLLKNALKNLKVKTVFIIGDRKYAKNITNGLNTQIPIDNIDLITSEKSVADINNLLKTKNLIINKIGENEFSSHSFNLLEFVKVYYNATMKPGKSKNYNKTRIDTEIDSIRDNLVKNNNIVEDIFYCLEIEKIWKNELKKYTDNLNVSDNIYKYGKNYFISFCILYFNEKYKNVKFEINKYSSFSVEMIFSLFNLFCDYFEKNNLDVSFNDFKNDNLFKELENFLFEYINMVESTNEIEKLLDDLKEYINNNFNNRYNIHSLISKFLVEKNVILNNYRIISSENNKIAEHYPLLNETFNEIIDSFNINMEENTDVKRLVYDKSKLKIVLNNHVNIFLIEWLDKKKVKDIKFIKELNLISLDKDEKEAKKIYNIVIEAFEAGDFSKLPSSSENQQFYHIRPKARNGDDTFTFTDGKDYTKQTFWVNKTHLTELIQKHFEDKSKR